VQASLNSAVVFLQRSVYCLIRIGADIKRANQPIFTIQLILFEEIESF
jgi:hypothetical protein